MYMYYMQIPLRNDNLLWLLTIKEKVYFWLSIPLFAQRSKDM